MTNMFDKDVDEYVYLTIKDDETGFSNKRVNACKTLESFIEYFNNCLIQQNEKYKEMIAVYKHACQSYPSLWEKTYQIIYDKLNKNDYSILMTHNYNLYIKQFIVLTYYSYLGYLIDENSSCCLLRLETMNNYTYHEKKKQNIQHWY